MLKKTTPPKTDASDIGDVVFSLKEEWGSHILYEKYVSLTVIKKGDSLYVIFIIKWSLSFVQYQISLN